MPRLRSQANGGCSDDDSGSVTAVLVVLTIILILAVLWSNCRHRKNKHLADGGSCGRFNANRVFDAAELGARDGPAPPRERLEVSSDALSAPDAPQRRSVHAALSRMYSTADVDPLVTGQLYGHADDVRNVYAQRTSHGDVWGLVEYSSSGGSGDVGVDEGPFGLAEYGGRQAGFDDGIPEAWALPATPIRWYRPAQRDHYGPEGPTVYSEGLFSLTEPDHDVLVN
jgi:hypothetical protein